MPHGRLSRSCGRIAEQSISREALGRRGPSSKTPLRLAEPPRRSPAQTREGDLLGQPEPLAGTPLDNWTEPYWTTRRSLLTPLDNQTEPAWNRARPPKILLSRVRSQSPAQGFSCYIRVKSFVYQQFNQFLPHASIRQNHPLRLFTLAGKVTSKQPHLLFRSSTRQPRSPRQISSAHATFSKKQLLKFLTPNSGGKRPDFSTLKNDLISKTKTSV